MALANPAIPTRTSRHRWNDLRTRTADALPRLAAALTRTRTRLRRPALTTTGFALIDAAAWHTLGLGAGLLVLGTLTLVFEALGGEE